MKKNVAHCKIELGGRVWELVFKNSTIRNVEQAFDRTPIHKLMSDPGFDLLATLFFLGVKHNAQNDKEIAALTVDRFVDDYVETYVDFVDKCLPMVEAVTKLIAGEDPLAESDPGTINPS